MHPLEQLCHGDGRKAGAAQASVASLDLSADDPVLSVHVGGFAGLGDLLTLPPCPQRALSGHVCGGYEILCCLP